MQELRGLGFLIWLTIRRQATGRKAIVAGVLVGLLCLATVLWARRNAPAADAEPAAQNAAVVQFARRVIMPAYLHLLLPIVILMHAVAALGDERDERTMVYLLARPLARWRLYIAKGIGVLPLALAWGLGSFWLLCLCAGPTGLHAWRLFWPAIARACIAYNSLFLLFGAIVPRPLVVAVVYSFFVETLVGSMPGTIKRISVSFHAQCQMYEYGAPIGLTVGNAAEFLPVSGTSAGLALELGAGLLLVLGAVLFHRREFWD